MIKPAMIFFGEPILAMREAALAAERASLSFVIGSSLMVYPATWLPQSANGQVAVVNQGPAEIASLIGCA